MTVFEVDDAGTRFCVMVSVTLSSVTRFEGEVERLVEVSTLEVDVFSIFSVLPTEVVLAGLLSFMTVLSSVLTFTGELDLLLVTSTFDEKVFSELSDFPAEATGLVGLVVFVTVFVRSSVLTFTGELDRLEEVSDFEKELFCRVSVLLTELLLLVGLTVFSMVDVLRSSTTLFEGEVALVGLVGVLESGFLVGDETFATGVETTGEAAF